MNKSEEKKKNVTPPPPPPKKKKNAHTLCIPAVRVAGLSQYQLDAPVTQIHDTFASPSHPQEYTEDLIWVLMYYWIY